MSLKVFGKLPDGERLDRIKKSANYKEAIFQNISLTPAMAPGASIPKMMLSFLNKPKDVIPQNAVPFIKSDLNKILPTGLVITWFGHSSYLLQVEGKNILVDPVFSGHASPFSFMIPSFKGTNEYSVADMPAIDILLITHDHYDHLDFKTICQLKNKVKKICCSLGVGAHLNAWGFSNDIITEFDWWDTKFITENIQLTATPARHFSGRGIQRGKTLWSSFILSTPIHKIYIGGDSGYDTHFKTIGEKYGPFDLALLECGQYNTNWPYIHMMPEETVQAAIDLQSKVLMPVHWGKFALALHPWDEPINRLCAKAAAMDIKMTTPMIGEQVILNTHYPASEWWKQV
jgi:L-ascorbate metabolism protein UlaG (beta-lactamase superfamily)